MRISTLLILALALALSASCQTEKVTETTSTSRPPGDEQQSERDSPSGPTPTPPPAATPNEPGTQEAPVSVQTRIPAPSLFDTSWEDRESFRSGLIRQEQEVLNVTPGASVYHIDLQLGKSLLVVQGQEEIRFQNQESVVLESLYLHLFPNLLGGKLIVSEVQIDERATIPHYLFGRSVMELPLIVPLKPGEEVVVSIAFTTSVPTESAGNYGIFLRSDDILALAHFYPLVAVFDDEGWNIEPPVAQGDIVYADVSYYLVRVTAPAEQVLVTSGIELAREVRGALQTITFAAGPARDFYLAASERFQVFKTTVDDTQINSYAPEEFSGGAREVLDFASAALQIFGDRFGSYPYTELDIVPTPNLVLGVEYPGIFTNNIRLYDGASGSAEEANVRDLLESTTVHETAHQWFYGVVGNDQLDEPWLDEALAQYATWLYYIDRYGNDVAQGFYHALERNWQSVERAAIPIGLPVREYDEAMYVAIIYGRGPIFVNELARTLGQDRFDAFLQDYYRDNQWEIATTEGFRLLAQQRCGCDLTSLFQEWVLGE